MAEQLLIRIKALDNFSPAFRQVQTGLGQIQAGLQRFGTSASQIGRTLTTSVTLPLIGVGVLGVKTAMDIEQKWAEVRKVYDGTGASIKSILVPAVSSLSKELGFQKTQTLDALGAIAAMGYTGSEATDLLAKSMRFARLGAMDLNQSMEAVVAVSKIYNVTGKDLQKNLALLNEVENVSAASMEDLTWGIKEAASTGRSAGVSLQELSAMMAVMRERAIPAGEAAFALKSIFTRLRNPVGEAKDILDKYNITVSNTKGEVRDADEILVDIASNWGKLTEAEQEQLATELAGIYQKGRFLSLIQDLSGGQSTYQKVLGKTADENKNLAHFQRELNIFTDQSKVKWEALKVRLLEVAETIGQRLIPQVIQVGQYLARLGEDFNRLDPNTQRFIINAAMVAAVLGPAVFALGQLALSITSLISLGASIGTVLSGLGTAIGAVAGVTGAAVLGFVGLFAVLAGSMYILGNYIGMQNPLIEAKRRVKDAVDAVGRAEDDLEKARENRKKSIKDLEQTNINLEQAQLRVEEATQRVIDTEAQYGAQSPQARQARLDLRQAELNLRDATDKSNTAKAQDITTSGELTGATHRLTESEGKATIAAAKLSEAQHNAAVEADKAHKPTTQLAEDLGLVWKAAKSVWEWFGSMMSRMKDWLGLAPKGHGASGAWGGGLGALKGPSPSLAAPGGGGRIGGLSPKISAAWNYLQALVPGNQIISSGLRPGAVVKGTNRPSLHGSGRAIDVSARSPNIQQFANAAFAYIGLPGRTSGVGKTNIGEVLWQTMVGGNHFSHVHLGLFGKGGHFMVDKPSMFVAGEAGKEEVKITPAGQRSDNTVNVYVGTLVADKFGLMELEKKLADVRTTEALRRSL